MDLCHWAKDRGVKVVTAFGFSTENWNRSEREVNYLMNLLELGLRKNFSDKAVKNEAKELGVQVRIIGQKYKLPESLQEAIREVEEGTKQYSNLVLNLAVSYGGKWDITQAVQQIVKEGIAADEITEETIAERLSTAGLPNPDLIIRPGGEKRMSNFVIWQGAYAELYFCKKYWPDFEEQDLQEAFDEYARRQRRFGH